MHAFPVSIKVILGSEAFAGPAAVRNNTHKGLVVPEHMFSNQASLVVRAGWDF